MKKNLTESSLLFPNERIISLDIIRGFALFGIFLVNMPLFQTPQLVADIYVYSFPLTPTDEFIRLVLDVFVEAKFFTIFSFLFGIGFYIFMRRAEIKGAKFYNLFFRRLMTLALFGILHLVFLWYGDILLIYAVSGFFLIFFYRKKQKTILLWLLAFTLVLVGLLSLSFLGSTETLEREINTLQVEGEPKIEEAIHNYHHNDYLGWVSYRFVNEVIPVIKNIPFSIPTTLFVFLMGLYAAKRGVFSDFATHRRFVKQVWWISLLFSIPLSVLIIILHLGLLDFGILTEQMIQVFLTISGLSLSLFYISTILFLLQNEKVKIYLHPLSYVGRMALTNYIIQTLIGVGLFTGFGMFGEVNLSLGVLVCFIVFPFQVLFSYLWLRYYRFGPLEWVWRSVTYGKLQPMKNSS